MKNVSVLSLSFGVGLDELYPDESDVLNMINENVGENDDAVLFPESFIMEKAYALDDTFIHEMKSLCVKHHVNIVCPINRISEDNGIMTSVLFFDRHGKQVFCYNKIFPYYEEFEEHGSPMPKTPGFETVIGDADFGKVSALLCFDANFPEVWRDVALRGADIVFFLSAYSAGRQLAAHALNNHYYIISCTMFPDFSVFNITGNEIHYSGGVKKDLLVSRAVIDTDKVICHTNFNEEKIKKMLEENPGVIEIEQFYEREQWYVFRSPCKGSVTKDICKKYEIENLRDYQNRSRAYINTKRKYPIKWMKEKP